MNTQPVYRILSLAALLGIWSCSSTRQTAQNTSEMDDLYGTSGNAAVYASNSSDYASVAPNRSRTQRYDRQQQRSSMNQNPDYSDDKQGYNANTDEYYSELSARKLNRGLSPDPGWNDNGGTNAYSSGFSNGYNSALTSAYSWNRWGYNNTGFYNGLGLGMGMGYGGFNRFSYGFGSPFSSPFYGGGGYGYSPFGYGGYDPFRSSYAYGGYGGYGGGYGGFGNPYYSPFYGNSFGNSYGGGYGGFYGSPSYVNNAYVSGADPYRNRTYNRTNERSAGRYSAGFDNSPRTYNPNGGRSSANAGSATSGSREGYYARPSNSSRGSYYYDNGSSSNGRSSATTNAPAYNSNSGSNSEYYARPRESSRGSYTPSTGSSSNGRSSYQQPSYQPSQRSYQQQSQPAYQNSRGSQPSYQQSQPSYSAPSRSYNAPSTPSYSAPSSGGGSYSAPSSGGSSRGPR